MTIHRYEMIDRNRVWVSKDAKYSGYPKTWDMRKLQQYFPLHGPAPKEHPQGRLITLWTPEDLNPGTSSTGAVSSVLLKDIAGKLKNAGERG
jgi:hypothetical protein